MFSFIMITIIIITSSIIIIIDFSNISKFLFIFVTLLMQVKQVKPKVMYSTSTGYEVIFFFLIFNLFKQYYYLQPLLFLLSLLLLCILVIAIVVIFLHHFFFLSFFFECWHRLSIRYIYLIRELIMMTKSIIIVA